MGEGACKLPENETGEFGLLTDGFEGLQGFKNDIGSTGGGGHDPSRYSGERNECAFSWKTFRGPHITQKCDKIKVV